MNQALRELFSNPWIRKFPAPALVASALATMVHPLLAGIGFELSAAAGVLAQVGFKVAAELLPTLIEAAKKGIQALADWFEREMAETPEVNQAAAYTMVEQAGEMSQTVVETHPADKDEIAEAVRQGLEAYGGALSAIAGQYSAAMKNAAELDQQIDQMRRKLDARASQTVTARRGSKITNVEMRIKKKAGSQEIIAEDDSSVSDVKQSID
jgi:hypothetical protein